MFKIKKRRKISNSNIDDIIALTHILKKLKDTEKFKKWLRNFHGIEEDKEIFQGYLYFVRLNIMGILDKIAYSNFPFLEEDVIFERVKNYLDYPFYPLPEPKNLFDVPNTCSKITFIKNMLVQEAKIAKAKNFDSLNNELDNIVQFIELISYIFEELTVAKIKTPKDELVNLKILQTLNTYFDQIQFHEPWIANVAIFFRLRSASQAYKGLTLKGYVFTLQYIWFQFIDKNKFYDFTISKLSNIIDEKIKTILRNKEYENKQILVYWNRIDDFCNSSNYIEIIQPRLKKFMDYLEYEPLFEIKYKETSEVKKRLLAFLDNKNAGEPQFLQKKDQDSLFKQLDIKFLWMPIEVIAFTGESEFYWSKLFIVFLKGLIENQDQIEGRKIIHVKIIKHPVKQALGKIKYLYSFAFLPAYDRNYYRSGWVLFHNCISEIWIEDIEVLDKVFSEIYKLENANKIKIEEIQVKNSDFKKYIAERNLSFLELRLFEKSLPSKDVLDAIEELEINVIDIFRKFQSRVLENMVCKWLLEVNQSDIKDTGYYIYDFENKKEYEFDIIVNTNENTISIYECKMDIREFDFKVDIIKKIFDKAELLVKKDKKYLNKKYNNYIVIWNKINPERKKLFESNKIKVIDNFKEVIRRIPKFKSEKRSIVKYMDIKELYSKEDNI